MADQSDIISHLLASPEAFEFVQAMRLLRIDAARKSGKDKPASEPPDPSTPHANAVQVIANPSLGYPATELAAVVDDMRDESTNSETSAPLLVLNFLGLHGPSGVLPSHVTQEVRSSGRQMALAQILDYFNGYLAAAYAEIADSSNIAMTAVAPSSNGVRDVASDPVSRWLLSVGGVSDGKSDKSRRGSRWQEIAVSRYYASAWRSRPMALTSLQSMLQELLAVPVCVLPFEPLWTNVEIDSRLKLPSRGEPARRASGWLLGRRTHQTQWGVVVRIGPVNLRTFCSLLPGRSLMWRIATLIGSALGPWSDFVIQPVLSKDDIRPWVMYSNIDRERRLSAAAGKRAVPPAALGRTMFLCKNLPTRWRRKFLASLILTN